MTKEAPFGSREKLKEKQRYYQSVAKYTHLRFPSDKIISVAIPAALAVSSIFLIGRGIYHMANGIEKNE